NSYRKERDRGTLGFLLATPLSTDSILLGHLTGPIAPTPVLWGWAALVGLIPAGIIAADHDPMTAILGWIVAFGGSLLYLLTCALYGANIGIALDRTGGTALLSLGPALLWGVAIAAGVGLYMMAGAPYPLL